MNRREHGCAYQTAVAEWQKVKMVMNQNESFRLLENRLWRNMIHVMQELDGFTVHHHQVI